MCIIHVADEGHARTRFFRVLGTAGEHHPPAGSELRQLVKEHLPGSLLLHRPDRFDDGILP